MEKITLHYLGCSAFILAGEGGSNLGIDFWTKGAFDYSEDTPADPFAAGMPKLARLLVTHDHDDHSYIPEGCPVLYGKNGDAVVEDNESLLVGGFGIRRIKTDHFPKGMKYQCENTVFAIETLGTKIVHLGDFYGTMKTPESLSELKMKLGDIDLLLIPIGSPFLTRIETPAIFAALEVLKPKALVPMHYWTVGDKKDVLKDLRDSGYGVIDFPGSVSFSSETFRELDGKVIWNITPAEFRKE